MSISQLHSASLIFPEQLSKFHHQWQVLKAYKLNTLNVNPIATTNILPLFARQYLASVHDLGRRITSSILDGKNYSPLKTNTDMIKLRYLLEHGLTIRNKMTDNLDKIMNITI